MHPIDLLPTPLDLVEQLVSALSSSAFDVNIRTNTGFYPMAPLPRLPDAFAVWENALSTAKRELVLGEDIPDNDRTQRATGERLVSIF